MEVRAEIESRSGGRRTIETQILNATDDSNAIWLMNVDLRRQLGLSGGGQRSQQILNDIVSMKIYATLSDSEGHLPARAELLLLAHDSPHQKNIKVSTSTAKPKVGEYIILHVQSNFYHDTFNYLIMSKGMILLSGQEVMQHNVHTFAIPLSPEMAPVATAVVYYVERYGDVITDSLTFPVNGN